ncbi:MAG: diguanylate cyclase [Solibacillus sp.]
MFKYAMMLIYILFSVQMMPLTPSAESAVQFPLETKQTLHAKLAGEWLFFHEQLLTDTEAAKAIARGEGQTVTVPIEYNQFLNDTNTYGTFATTITVPQHYIGQILAMQVPFEYSAVKIFASDQFVLESGTVGINSASHDTMLERKTGYFDVEQQTFTIAVQISSFNHIRGGFANAILLGEPAKIQKETDQQNFMILFIIGILTIIGLLTILVGLYERTERRLLVFGLFVLTVVTRTLVTVPFLYRLLPLPISYELATRTEYITTILIGYLYTVFIYMVFTDLFHKWVVYLNFAILTFLAISILFTEPATFQAVFFKGFILEVLMILYNVYVISRALVKKRPLALAHAIGISIVFSGMIIDYLAGLAIINAFPVSHICAAIHVVIIVVSISRNYAAKATETARLNKELIALNNSLDLLVQKRTTEIHLANQELHEANEQLQQLALRDGLTGIYNRRYFDTNLKECFKQAKQQGIPLSVLLFDLDEFKKYNDYYGHILGDDLLCTITQLIAQTLPENALFARYGGEEFSVILPGYDRPEATNLAHAIGTFVEQAGLEHIGRELGIITLSIGGATFTSDSPAQTEIELLKLADQQLYMAKKAGRNQVQFN